MRIIRVLARDLEVGHVVINQDPWSTSLNVLRVNHRDDGKTSVMYFHEDHDTWRTYGPDDTVQRYDLNLRTWP